MPLTLLVPLIVVGIAAVLLAVRFIGGSKELALTDPTIRARFAEDFPHAEIIAVHITDDAKTAWLTFKDRSSVGLMQRFGSGTIVRTISAADINHTEFSKNRVIIHLNDFAMKSVVIEGQPDALRNALDAMKEIP